MALPWAHHPMPTHRQTQTMDMRATGRFVAAGGGIASVEPALDAPRDEPPALPARRSHGRPTHAGGDGQLRIRRGQRADIQRPARRLGRIKPRLSPANVYRKHVSRLASPACRRASRGRPTRCPLARTFLSHGRTVWALIFRAETPRGRDWVDETLHPGIGLQLSCKRSFWPGPAFRWAARQAPRGTFALAASDLAGMGRIHSPASRDTSRRRFHNISQSADCRCTTCQSSSRACEA